MGDKPVKFSPEKANEDLENWSDRRRLTQSEINWVAKNRDNVRRTYFNRTFQHVLPAEAIRQNVYSFLPQPVVGEHEEFVKWKYPPRPVAPPRARTDTVFSAAHSQF